MENDFAGKEETPTATAELDKINTWNKITTDDPVEAEMLAEVNEVYHKYGRPVSYTPWILDTWTQTAKLQSSIQGRPKKSEIIYTLIQQPQASEHHSSIPGLHLQWYYTKCQCKLCTRNIQHGSTILHIPTGTVHPTAELSIHPKSTVPQQPIRGETKHPSITVRRSSTH